MGIDNEKKIKVLKSQLCKDTCLTLRLLNPGLLIPVRFPYPRIIWHLPSPCCPFPLSPIASVFKRAVILLNLCFVLLFVLSGRVPVVCLRINYSSFLNLATPTIFLPCKIQTPSFLLRVSIGHGTGNLSKQWFYSLWSFFSFLAQYLLFLFKNHSAMR